MHSIGSLIYSPSIIRNPNTIPSPSVLLALWWCQGYLGEGLSAVVGGGLGPLNLLDVYLESHKSNIELNQWRGEGVRNSTCGWGLLYSHLIHLWVDFFRDIFAFFPKVCWIMRWKIVARHGKAKDKNEGADTQSENKHDEVFLNGMVICMKCWECIMLNIYFQNSCMWWNIFEIRNVVSKIKF